MTTKCNSCGAPRASNEGKYWQYCGTLFPRVLDFTKIDQSDEIMTVFLITKGDIPTSKGIRHRTIVGDCGGMMVNEAFEMLSKADANTGILYEVYRGSDFGAGQNELHRNEKGELEGDPCGFFCKNSGRLGWCLSKAKGRYLGCNAFGYMECGYGNSINSKIRVLENYCLGICEG